MTDGQAPFKACPWGEVAEAREELTARSMLSGTLARLRRPGATTRDMLLEWVCPKFPCETSHF